MLITFHTTKIHPFADLCKKVLQKVNNTIKKYNSIELISHSFFSFCSYL